MSHELSADHVLLPNLLSQILIVRPRWRMTLVLVFTDLQVKFEDQLTLLPLETSLMYLVLYVTNLRLFWKS